MAAFLADLLKSFRSLQALPKQQRYRESFVQDASYSYRVLLRQNRNRGARFTSLEDSSIPMSAVVSTDTAYQEVLSEIYGV